MRVDWLPQVNPPDCSKCSRRLRDRRLGRWVSSSRSVKPEVLSRKGSKERKGDKQDRNKEPELRGKSPHGLTPFYSRLIVLRRMRGIGVGFIQSYAIVWYSTNPRLSRGERKGGSINDLRRPARQTYPPVSNGGSHLSYFSPSACSLVREREFGSLHANVGGDVQYG